MYSASPSRLGDTVTRADLAAALGRGYRGLLDLQKPDGSFATTGNPHRLPALVRDPIFSTASVVLSVGGHLPEQSSAAALTYMQGRARRDGLFEWRGCPADADDSALCLAALARYGLINADRLNVLRRFWREPGGPFFTWLESPATERLPPDPVVNLNVLFALSVCDLGPSAVEQTGACTYALKQVGRSSDWSEYYAAQSTLFYVAARANVASIFADAAERYATREGERLPSQSVAELISAYPKLFSRFLPALLKAQNVDGTWPESAWFFDFSGDFCSRAYATAVALEALHRSLKQLTTVRYPSSCTRHRVPYIPDERPRSA